MAVNLTGLKKNISQQKAPTASSTPLVATERPNQGHLRRKTWFRLLAVLCIPAALLLVTEGALRLGNFGYSPHFFLRRDIESRNVWTDNQAFGRRFFPPGLVRYPRSLSFPVSKPANSLRIFVLGESAAMGDPDPKFGFPRMLEVLLRERFAGRKIEVVNAAMVAINSHVILPIARDCAALQGDLWIIYMGNNEIIGPFGSATVFGRKAPPLPVVRGALSLKSTRLGQLMDSVQGSLRLGKRPLPEWAGMEMMADQKIRYDAAASVRVYEHFEQNLADILSTGARVGVSIVLCTVATNLRDCAPFASLHRSGLSSSDLTAWQAAYDSGVALQNEGKPAEARNAYDKAAQLDGEFADLAFRRAECCRLLGQDADAAAFFTAARDCDALQFRADGRINKMVRAAGKTFANRGVTLLDAEQIFATNSPQATPGAELFYEHVHFTPEGNYLLAHALAEEAATVLGLKSDRDWVSQEECLHLLGFTGGNRYEALDSIRERMEGPPFTTQIDHARQLQRIQEQIARYRASGKPAQVRRDTQQLSQLVARQPEDADLRWNLASLLESGGALPAAEEQWRACIRLQPQAALPRINLARVLERLGRDAEALPLYTEGLRINPDYSPARQAMGSLCLRMGRLPQAIHYLGIVVAQRPQSIEMRLALGDAFAKANRTADARREFQEVLRLDPNNPTAQTQLRTLRR